MCTLIVVGWLVGWQKVFLLFGEICIVLVFVLLSIMLEVLRPCCKLALVILVPVFRTPRAYFSP